MTLELEEKHLKGARREAKNKRRKIKGGSLATQKKAMEISRYYRRKKKGRVRIIDRRKCY